MSLDVIDLTKRYGGKTVVDHLSFSMPGPGVYALLGTNGAGKTTTIRMMLGTLSRDGGQVLWDGKELDPAVCNLGYLAEERGLYPKYPLMDQLMYFAGLRGVKKDTARQRIRYLAHRLQVEEYLYPDAGSASHSLSYGSHNVSRIQLPARQKKQKPKLADQLSKGNQQKIQLMTALLSDPDLIVLDEPLSGLDPVNTDLFKSLIREEIEKGKYLILSSHQMATVEEFCTDLTILDRAKPVLQGNLNQIKKSYGRVNLSLKVEQDIAPLIQACGVTLLSEKEYEYQLKVTGEEQATRLLAELIARQIPVITFDLREPSLHEIFVETVGGERHELE